jgi:hypothetical protein
MASLYSRFRVSLGYLLQSIESKFEEALGWLRIYEVPYPPLGLILGKRAGHVGTGAGLQRLASTRRMLTPEADRHQGAGWHQDFAGTRHSGEYAGRTNVRQYVTVPCLLDVIVER